jgi:hypothetical protein
MIPMRRITAGFRRLFLVFCKCVHRFLGFGLVCYLAELLILYAFLKNVQRYL